MSCEMPLITAWNNLLDRWAWKPEGQARDMFHAFFMVYDKLSMQGKEVHIGELVKSVFDESGMSVAELARRLHCERPNVYSIFSRSNMDVGLLICLSKILNHNFLADIIRFYKLPETPCSQLSIHITPDNFTEEQIDCLKALLDEFKQKQ